MCYNSVVEFETLNHPFKPIFNKNSKILILGSMPSPTSRQEGFYFAHKQNRFWKILSTLFNEELSTIESKKQFLINHKIALWDVVKSCEIVGASDSSIKNVQVNDFNIILKVANIKAIFTLGKTATKFLKKYTNLNCIELPSSSPANCAVPFEELLNKYKIILNFVN